MRAFRIRGQYYAILWPPSGPLERRFSRQKGTAAPLEEAVAAVGGWQKLEGVVAAAEQLSDTMSADPLAHVVQGWPRFRRYAPRMLRALEIQASGAGEPILAALRAIGAGSRDMPRTFLRRNSLRRNSRWHQHINARPAGDRRLWEVAALFHMRDAFRCGDVWLAHSRRYGDVKRALVPIEAAHATARLAVPFEPREWLAERKAGLVEGLDRLADAAHHGRIPGGAIENGELRIGRPASAVPEDVDELVLDLYRRLPEVRTDILLTDILLEVDAATGCTDACRHLRTGAPCKDRIGLLNVLLAEGLNLGNCSDLRGSGDYSASCGGTTKHGISTANRFRPLKREQLPIWVSARWPRPPTPMTSSSSRASRAGISKARR